MVYLIDGFAGSTFQPSKLGRSDFLSFFFWFILIQSKYYCSIKLDDELFVIQLKVVVTCN